MLQNVEMGDDFPMHYLWRKNVIFKISDKILLRLSATFLDHNLTDFVPRQKEWQRLPLVFTNANSTEIVGLAT